MLVNAGADIGLQSPAGAKQSGEDVGGWTAQILAVSCPSNRAELAKLLGRGDRPGPDQPRPPYVPFDMMDELTELAELASELEAPRARLRGGIIIIGVVAGVSSQPSARSRPSCNIL